MTYVARKEGIAPHTTDEFIAYSKAARIHNTEVQLMWQLSLRLAVPSTGAGFWKTTFVCPEVLWNVCECSKGWRALGKNVRSSLHFLEPAASES